VVAAIGTTENRDMRAFFLTVSALVASHLLVRPRCPGIIIGSRAEERSRVTLRWSECEGHGRRLGRDAGNADLAGLRTKCVRRKLTHDVLEWIQLGHPGPRRPAV
jgi:hypothetical protein